MTLDLKQSALRYLALGCLIIPVGSDKRPLLPSWKEFQARRPSADEVQRWCDDLNPQGVAIVTGAISGLVVLDVEAAADISTLALPPTVTAKTGGGGWHFYLLPPPALTLGNAVRFRPAMDFKGEGGYVVAPPSVHPSGNRYEWAVGFDDAEVAPLPAWLIQDVQAPRPVSRPWEEIITGVPEGQRNQSAASVAGTVLARFPPDEWEAIGWPALFGWNKQNDPPLTERELRTVWESIRRAELRKRTPAQSRGEATPHPALRREARGIAASQHECRIRRCVGHRPESGVAQAPPRPRDATHRRCRSYSLAG